MPVERVVGFDKCVCRHPELVNLYGCSIGEETKIGSFVEIGEGVLIGKRCKIQSFVFIPPGVTIGDDVFIGPHVCFTNVRVPDPYTPAKMFTPTVVENGVVIGANATIVCGALIGMGSFIGAGAVVVHDVTPFTTVYGNPARAR